MTTQAADRPTGISTSGSAQFASPLPERAVKSRKADEFANRKVWLQALIAILLISGCAYFSVSNSRPKFNRSEIAYAEISREMLEHKSYIVPLYRGVPCIDKPVLNYWAIIPCFAAFGPSGIASRIPSMVAALLCLGLFAAGIRRFWGWQSSLLATMILATSQRYWEFATLCMTDMLLTLFDTVALTSLYIGLQDKNKRLPCYLIAAASMGLGTLTKGPVALILPCASYFFYIVATKQLRTLNVVQIAIAAIVFFAVAAPWYVLAASQVTTTAGIGAWLWHHNVERFFGSAYAYHYSPLYMVQSLFMGFAPWSIFLPFALFSAVKRWQKKIDVAESKQELYLWIWLILTTTFFTFSRGKMNYYDLPAFPAAAGVVALSIHHWIKNKQIGNYAGAWLLTAGLFGGAVTAAYMLPLVTQSSDIESWAMMPVGLMLCAIAAAWALLKDKSLVAYGAMFAGISWALISFSLQIHPLMAKQSPANSYIQIMKLHPEARIAIHGDFAKTIDWYDAALFETRKIPAELNGTDDLAAYMRKPEPALIIVTEDRFKMLPQDVRAQAVILESRPSVYKKLDLGFLAKSRGKLTDSVPLLLVSNRK